MRIRHIVGVVIVSAITVVVTDLMLQSTLLRTLWPLILTPADGAITSPPVTVQWEGPQPLIASLTGSGLRTQLGLRQSPFEINANHFPRAGQYRIELRSPTFGSLVWVERRFVLRTIPAENSDPVSEGAEDGPADGQELEQMITHLQIEYDRMRAENNVLQKENTQLALENRDLSVTLNELREDRASADAQLATTESQQTELTSEYSLALQENQILRRRLQSIPACTTWGYVSYLLPQSSQPARNVVVVSNIRGQVFRTRAQCVQWRQGDLTAASECFCAGTVWVGDIRP